MNQRDANERTSKRFFGSLEANPRCARGLRGPLWNYRARVWVPSRYRQFLLPHLDQVLRGQAYFFAIHTNDDAGVGFDC